MSTRLLVFTLLAVIVVAGLISGIFIGSIERVLTLPVMHQMTTMIGAGAQKKPPAAPAPTATPTLPTLAPTQVLAQDSFQRADQPSWGRASDGHMWLSDQGAPPDAAVFSIAGRTGQIANGQGTFNALLGPVGTNVEVMMSGSVNHFAANGGVNLGVVLRWTDKTHWYKALIDGARLEIIKPGGAQALATTPFQAQDGTAYTLRFRAIGAMLFAKVWQTGTPEPANWMLTVMDTTYTSGYVGVRPLLQKNTVITIDSFEATTASSAM